MSESLVESIEAKSLHEAMVDVVKRTLAENAEPIPFPELRRQLPGPYQRDEAALRQTLDELLGLGQIHQFAPYKSKADRYWTKPLNEYAMELIIDQSRGQFVTKAKLREQVKNRLKDLSNKAIEDLIQQLVRTGKLQQGRFLGSSSQRISSSPFDAQALLDDAVEQIARRFSISVASVRALALERVEPAAEPLPAVDASADDLVIGAIAELRPGDANLVSIAELRRYLAWRLDREAFDAAILRLEHDAKIDLTIHPDAGSLTEQERHERMLGSRSEVYDIVIVRS